MAVIEQWPPFDLDGEWSPRQADAVIDALADEAKSRGVVIRKIDAPTGAARVSLQLTCARHGHVVPLDDCCPDCLKTADFLAD